MYKSIALMLALALPATAQVVVVDGDTLNIGDTRYRINGMDAPETAQKCQNASGRDWHCGARATEALERLVIGRDVSCTALAIDGYDRTIAHCSADGVDLAQAMIRSGMAWAFLKFSDEYESDQAIAKTAKRGIWQGTAQPAWAYRAEKWAVAEQVAPDGCPIKGNISKFGQIYHTPWSRWYTRTSINVAKGERWFCDEAEALAAGWRPAKSY